ncbi:hypothetical protein [Mycobacterium intracellulare]|uniref:hypothetical protein n=1 Tax=Mycobacterium intracellulare TaxID=1767 RepID=UPI00044D0C74|nr:hypothetical protein [Mycobacterium intracellulare]ETZ38091.1 hypothetical protein L842_6099 [Mycobacterium intracellulare MIN_052511_1280]
MTTTDPWASSDHDPTSTTPPATVEDRPANGWPDIAPTGRYGVLHWANGKVWIPQRPTWTAALFNPVLRHQRRNYITATAAQIRALARQLENQAPSLITEDQAAAWSGRPLSPKDIEQLSEAIPHSSIPDAINTITGSWND